MTNVLGPKKHRPDTIKYPEFKAIITNLQEADTHPYYTLRNQAIVCTLWLTGKRANEVATIPMENIKQTPTTLDIGFIVGKKRTITRYSTRIKKLPLQDPYTKPIIEYINHMKKQYPDTLYLYPSTRYSNLTNTVTINPEKPLSRTTIWRIVTSASPDIWTHLFRETMGARTVQRYGDTINGLFAVKRRLDLERLDTAMRYVERYAGERIESSVPDTQIDTLETTNNNPNT